MSELESVISHLARIDQRLEAGTLQMQEMAHAQRELRDAVRQQNGRVGTLEASELKRALAEAESRGAARARKQLWAAVVAIGGAVFGAVGGFISRVVG